MEPLEQNSNENKIHTSPNTIEDPHQNRIYIFAIGLFTGVVSFCFLSYMRMRNRLVVSTITGMITTLLTNVFWRSFGRNFPNTSAPPTRSSGEPKKQLSDEETNPSPDNRAQGRSNIYNSYNITNTTSRFNVSGFRTTGDFDTRNDALTRTGAHPQSPNNFDGLSKKVVGCDTSSSQPHTNMYERSYTTSSNPYDTIKTRRSEGYFNRPFNTNGSPLIQSDEEPQQQVDSDEDIGRSPKPYRDQDQSIYDNISDRDTQTNFSSFPMSNESDQKIFRVPTNTHDHNITVVGGISKVTPETKTYVRLNDFPLPNPFSIVNQPKISSDIFQKKVVGKDDIENPPPNNEFSKVYSDGSKKQVGGGSISTSIPPITTSTNIPPTQDSLSVSSFDFIQPSIPSTSNISHETKKIVGRDEDSEEKKKKNSLSQDGRKKVGGDAEN